MIASDLQRLAASDVAAEDIDETHDPGLLSWVESAASHPQFPVQNLPLGIFSVEDGTPRAGVAIGEMILDLSGVSHLLPAAVRPALSGTTLNALFALPSDARRSLRATLSALLSDESNRVEVEPTLIEASRCAMHLPAAIGDYTDFYTGINHALNAGSLFRPDAPLHPNYKWIPVGYHGRASTVRVSGEAMRRPSGQWQADGGPTFGPSRQLDYEVEVGVWIGPGNAPGRPIAIGEAAAHIAGLCLLNDWSARDVQRWEATPLGPFLAKSVQTSVSPWVVTIEALAPFRVAQPVRPAGDPEPLPYLHDALDQAAGAFAIEIEACVSTREMRAQGLPAFRMSRAALTTMYWTVAQLVAHHTSNGCDLRPGDLLGTGTISGPDDGGLGSLLEITRGGRDPITLPTGETRTYLEDFDEVTLTGRAVRQGFAPIGLGECRVAVSPALSADEIAR